MARKKTHPGTLQKRGSSYRVILYVEGERYQYTVPTIDRSEAEAFARKQYEELQKEAARKQEGFPDPDHFSGLMVRYRTDRLPLLAPRTRETYEIALDYFHEFFVDLLQDPRIDKVRRADVIQFMNWRRSRRQHGEGLVSARTVAKDRAVLHSLFEYAEELEMRDSNPVAKTKPPKVEERDPVILTDAQYELLLRECMDDPMLYLFVLTCGETGARSISEVIRLRWEDVRLEDSFIWIPSSHTEHRTKSAKGRWVPMTPRLLDAMRQHFAEYRLASYDGRRPQYIFHHLRTRKRGKATLIAGERIRSLRHSFNAAIQRAKLPAGFRPHDLRHRRVTTWLAAEKNPVHVKEAMGHSDIRTTLGYTHLAKEHLRSLIDEEGPMDKVKRDKRS